MPLTHLTIAIKTGRDLRYDLRTCLCPSLQCPILARKTCCSMGVFILCISDYLELITGMYAHTVTSSMQNNAASHERQCGEVRSCNGCKFEMNGTADLEGMRHYCQSLHHSRGQGGHRCGKHRKRAMMPKYLVRATPINGLSKMLCVDKDQADVLRRW